MSDFNKADVGLLQVGCRMLDFNKSDVGFLQVGCQILAGRMANFYKSDVECRMAPPGGTRYIPGWGGAARPLIP